MRGKGRAQKAPEKLIVPVAYVRPILVLFQDRDVFVVDKPSGLLSVRTPQGKEQLDLIGVLRDYYGHDKKSSAYPVHRLDKNVSGLMIVARTKDAEQIWDERFKNREVRRIYHAMVHGLLPKDEGTFVSYLAANKGTLRMRSTRMGGPVEGKKAVTHYRVLKRFAKVTYVEVELETGLKNQIRAHFGEAGYPLLGDRKYLPTDHKDYKSVQGNRRIFLHAFKLEYTQQGKPVIWQSELPKDLMVWFERIEKAGLNDEIDPKLQNFSKPMKRFGRPRKKY